MFWYCDDCKYWGVAENAVEAAVAHQEHKNTHSIGASLGMTEPQQEPEKSDTAFNAKHVAWGITALLGLLSSHWPALGVLLPFAGLISVVTTFHDE